MSFTTVLFPIIAALLAPEGKFMEKNTAWNPVNAHQQIFLKAYYSETAKKQLAEFSDTELRSWASQDYEILNKIAKENGFDIQLKPFLPNSFGSLSILDILIKWRTKGIKTSINYNNNTYEAVKLNKNFEVFKLWAYDHPIAKIKTQGRDTVYITVADQALSDFDLVNKVTKLSNDINMPLEPGMITYPEFCMQENYDSIIFPAVNLNQTVDISWLLNMYCPEVFIAQALQQTKFKMDEEGARVQSAVMMEFAKCCMPQTEKILCIDKPFYIWIEREDCTIPVFAGYIDSANWVLNNN